MLARLLNRFVPRSAPRRPRFGRSLPLRLEALEDRTLLSGTSLHFTPADTAHVAGFLASPNQFDLYKVKLNAGDRLNAAVSAQTTGSGLQSILRVFNQSGTPLALDNQEGGDPTLTFQASTADYYLLGVSAVGDNGYDPNTANSGHGGATKGLYALDLRLTPGAALQSDLAGSSFRLDQATAAYGEKVSGAFTIENRGGADAAGFTVQVVLSTGPRFDGFDPSQSLPTVLSVSPPAVLAAGHAYTTSFTAQLPASAPANFPASGPVYVGLLILPNDPATDSGMYDKSGVHRGEDWESLTTVTPAPPGTTDLSSADAGLNTRVTDALAGAGQTKVYTLTVQSAGLLRAAVNASSGSTLVPRLTLSTLTGQPLLQSDAGSIVQFLPAGTYALTVSAQLGAGGYQLTSSFAQGSLGFGAVPIGSSSFSVTIADVNGDGRPDLVVAYAFNKTVSVLLGSGDGAFQTPKSFAVGSQPYLVTVVDVNGDGRPDIVVDNELDATVSVLLGNGDGTFQAQKTFAAGYGPKSVAVADVNGDGRPDLVASKGNTVSVQLGNGDGTFQAPKTIAAGYGVVTVADVNGDGRPDLVAIGSKGGSVLLGNGDGTFQTPIVVGSISGLVTVTDVNGDGRPDLVTGDGGNNTVSVLLGNGDGTFQAQKTFAVGNYPLAVTVADVNGDGRPDIVVANHDSSVSVLLGNGDGTFQTQTLIPAGSLPESVTVADVNGDGNPDIVVPSPATNYTGVGVGNSVLVLLGNGDGTFQAQKTFATGSLTYSVTVADVNGDGRPDLVVANRGDNTVSVLLGNGDGTFQAQKTFAVGILPFGVTVTAADVNGDGRIDLVVPNYGTASVLLGNGDGTFQAPKNVAIGSSNSVTVVDVNGDGRPDLVAGGSATVSVLLGNGDGTFQAPKTFGLEEHPYSVTVADVNGDGRPDLVVANKSDNTVSVLLGNGHGAFQNPKSFAVGSQPYSVTVADVNGDGRPDIVAANYGDNTVSVLLGNGDGAFQAQQTFAVGRGPIWVTVRDVNGDGHPDIVTANFGDNTVSVLLGNGNGTFQAQQIFATGSSPSSVTVADVNGDGHPDIVAANYGDNTVSVLLGNGNGTFQAQQTFAVGRGPNSVTLADVNGDGRPDLVTANYGDNTVSVLLGNGDGAFRAQQTFAVGHNPTLATVADVNGDGRPDLVVANKSDNTVSVLLGNGDGTFQAQQTFAAGRNPTSVTVADVNGDGRPDLVTANYGDNTVSVLLGNGDGTFQAQQTFAVGGGPYSGGAVTAADVNGDGRPDIVTSNGSVLLGNGDGTFQSPKTFALGGGDDFPVTVADVNGDGRPDLVFLYHGTISVLLGNGDGTFQAPKTFALGGGPYGISSVTVADVNGDGRADLVVANNFDSTVSVLLGNGDGTFQAPKDFAAGTYPNFVTAADLNGDGRPDLVVANYRSNSVTVLLGKGDGSFVPASSLNGVGVRNTPQSANLVGHSDGTLDSVVLDGSGGILFRQGLPGADNGFAPPITINATVNDPADGKTKELTARDLTALRTSTGTAIATADAIPDPTILATQKRFVFTVSIYAYVNGSFERPGNQPAFTTTRLPTRIFAGDLSGNGLDDLVVTNTLDNSIQVAFQRPDGTFSAPLTLNTDEAPSDVAFVDVNGDGRLDIVVTNQASGDITVFLNDASHSFAQVEHFRAGVNPYTVDTSGVTPALSSLEESVSLTSGAFTGDGRNDLVVVNRGADSFSVLQNDGNGGFTGPTMDLTTSVSDGSVINDQAGPVVAGYFNGASRPLDLAILMEGRDEVWIYIGDGHGHFTHTLSLAAGEQPTGLTVVEDPVSGFDDLLVGNQFGDVLRIIGNGDGTFSPFVNADQRVPLVLTKTSNGTPEVILANEAQDTVTAQVRDTGKNTFTPDPTFQKSRSDGLISPGALIEADLNNDGIPDLIIANSGSNNVLVYLGLQGGGFSATPQSFSVGDNPVGLYVARLTDTNGDGKIDNKDLPDLVVANQGSNDVSILLGATDANGAWTLKEGPRLASGGIGPIAVTSTTDPVTGVQDLLVTNGQSGNIADIPGIGSGGVGTGFFQDGNAEVQQISSGTVFQTQMLSSSGDLVGLALAQDGSLTRFDLTTKTSTTVAAPGSGIDTFLAKNVDGEAFPVIFTANANGSVSALVSADGLSYGAKATVSSDALTGPSALDVLQTDAGQFDVYVTDAGESTPVVLSLDLNAELTPVTSPGGNGNGNGEGNGNGNGNGNGEGNGNGDPGSHSPFNNLGGVVITLVTDLQLDATTTTQVESTNDPFSSAASEVTDVTTQAGLASNSGGSELLTSFGEAVLVNIVGLTDAPAPLTETGREAPTLPQFIVGVDDAIDRLVASQAAAPGAALTASADAALPAVADAVIHLGDWAGVALREEAGVRLPAVADSLVHWADLANLTRVEAPAVVFGAAAPGLLSDQRIESATVTDAEAPINYVSRDMPLVLNGKLVSGPAPDYSRDILLVMTAGLALGGVYATRRLRKTVCPQKPRLPI